MKKKVGVRVIFMENMYVRLTFSWYPGTVIKVEVGCDFIVDKGQ